MVKVAINGLGRIGRAALKLIWDTPELELEAVNDIVPIGNVAYLLKYDTVYGKFEKSIEFTETHLSIGGQKIRYYSERDPEKLPWKEHGIDIVFECTGVFTKTEDLKKHIIAGAKVAILSAPTKSPDMPTVVHGVNTGEGSQVFSCASCTTNSITPVVEIIGRRFGIKKAIMTTVHGYTATQALVDGPHRAMRRGRAAAANLVPTSTGAAIATTKALPQYEGVFDGIAIRAPVPVGSVSDIVMVTKQKTTVEEVNAAFKEEAAGNYFGILGVTEEPLVSSDIIKDPHAAIVDLGMTKVVDGDLLKVLAWYDNEWGYTNQMIREAIHVARTLSA